MLANCEGKEVRGSEGHRIGRVVRCDNEEVVVETGLFKVHDFSIPTDEIASMTDKEIYLRRPADAYKPGAPRSTWSPWHTGKRGAEARVEMEALKRADVEHRLGAQGIDGLKDHARSSVPACDVSEEETERADMLGGVAGTVEHDPLTPKEPRGSPPEARLPPVAHPEDEPWP